MSGKEFPLIPLRDLAEIRMGQSPESDVVFEGTDSGLPFLQGNAEFGPDYPNPLYSCSKPPRIADTGSVLVSVRAPVGERNIADREYCIGRGLSAVRFKNYASNLGKALIGLRVNDLKRVAQGTTFEAIGRKDLETLLVPNPPEPEAAVVAQILDTLDTQIRQTEALIAKLERIKQGLLTDLLTRGIDENGQLRPPPEEAPHLYKDSPLGWIPREWEVELLDNLARRGSGHTPSKSVPAYWNGGIKWVSLADSGKLGQVYIKDTDKEISDLGIANSSATKHPPGTVVLSRDAGIGRSAILASEMAVSQHFMAWQCGQYLHNLFLYYWLQWMKPRFEAIALGSTIQTIGLDYFKHLQIIAPSMGEQCAIAKRLWHIETVNRENRKSLGKAKKEKDGLMNDLLTGRIRVAPLLEKEKEGG